MDDIRQIRTAASIALALLCSACTPLVASPQYFELATPLCKIVADEQRYAGSQVLVSALLFHTPHGRTIFSPECEQGASLGGSSADWDRRSKALIDAALARNKRAEIPVVVSGIFQPWNRYENGKLIINVGGASIERGRIVAARGSR